MDNSLDTTQAQERPISNNKSGKTTLQPAVPKVPAKMVSLPVKEVELQYRVFSYTSQEDDGKAENLSLNSEFEGNPGWHSKRF